MQTQIPLNRRVPRNWFPSDEPNVNPQFCSVPSTSLCCVFPFGKSDLKLRVLNHVDKDVTISIYDL
jgi:hypothetical protein